MRAIQFTGPGKIVLLDDARRPQPEDGQVLVQCSHVGLCGSNVGPYLGDGRWGRVEMPSPPGWLGHENVGTIVRSRCEGWEPGTPVLAHPEDYNGFAEYIVSKPAGLGRLPAELPDPGAMVVAQPLATVLRALERIDTVVNRRCAVVGQGPMGLIFTQLLERMGARQVIAVDTVAWRLQWSRRFGASHVVDAGSHDVIEAVTELTGGELVDLCIEAVGHDDGQALTTAAHLPQHGGTLLVFGIPHHDAQPFPWWHTVTNETKILTRRGPECGAFFQTAIDMIVQGRVELTEMVTPRLPWDRATEAFEMYAHPADHEGSLKLTLVL